MNLTSHFAPLLQQGSQKMNILRNISTLAATGLLLGSFGSAQAALLIDQFTDVQSVSTSGTGTFNSLNTTGTSFIGDSREFEIDVSANTDNNPVNLQTTGGQLNFTRGSNTINTFSIIYSGGELLTGVDLTDGGDLDAFTFGVAQLNFTVDVAITVTDGDSSDTAIESLGFGIMNQIFQIDYTEYTGIDFTDVRGLQIDILGQYPGGATHNFGVDGLLNFVQASDETPPPSSSVPTPAPLGLLGLGLLGLLARGKRQG